MDAFKIDVCDSVLQDLRERLRRTRFPNQPRNAGWAYGANLDYVQRLVRYWLEEYDWRAAEARLNRFPHYMATVGDYRVHLIHERGSGPNPLPLVITHGWPGSFVEFDAVIEPLAHPDQFGGAVEDAFDVVVPTMPGYGWSSAPPEPMTPRDIAGLWHTLMTGSLGYDQYVAQGGDWGAVVTSWLGVDTPQSVAAIHVNMMGLRPYRGEGSAPPTPEEEAWVAAAQQRQAREAAYQFIQGTKPQTLAYGLTDSPVGLAAWIVEKFHGWTDPGAAEPPFRLDQLITNVMTYWLTRSANPASWLYWSARHGGIGALGRDEFCSVPTGFLCPPNDLIPPPPDSWIRRAYNLVRRTDLPLGGHFIALERGQDFVDDVRAFFRPYRTRS